MVTMFSLTIQVSGVFNIHKGSARLVAYYIVHRLNIPQFHLLLSVNFWVAET